MKQMIEDGKVKPVLDPTPAFNAHTHAHPTQKHTSTHMHGHTCARKHVEDKPKHKEGATNKRRPHPIHQDLDDLKQMIEDGKVKPVLDPTPAFNLDTVFEMFQVISSHRTKGKLRLVVADN